MRSDQARAPLFERDPTPNLDPAKSGLRAGMDCAADAGSRRRPACIVSSGRCAMRSRPRSPTSDTDIDGVWAPPGRYTVELIVDGKQLRQPLTGRARSAREARRRRLRAAVRVRARSRSGAARTRRRAGARRRICTRRSPTSARPSLATPHLRDAIDALDADVVARAGIVDAGNPHNAWSLPLDEQRRACASSARRSASSRSPADGADASPTPDARAGYAAAMPMLDRALADWKVFTATQLAALNAQLKAAGRNAISIDAPAKKSNR